MSFTYKYPRPALTVDCVIFNKPQQDLMVLLIQRKHPPFKGQWAFPGGFVDMDEELEVAAARELMEETGLKPQGLTQLHTYGTIGRDPRGRTVSVVYIGFADAENDQPKAGDDAQNAKWFSLKEIPDLAFDHYEILKHALQKIKS